MDNDDVEPTPVLQDDEGVHVYPPPPLMEQDASPPQQHDETTANIINDTAEQPTSNAATVSERTGDNETWQLVNNSGNYRNNNEINHPPDAFVTAPDAALGGNAAAAASFTDAAADDAANNSDHNLSEDVAAASTTSTTEEAAVAITLETSTPFRKRKRYRKRKRDPKAPKLPRSALELYQRDTRKAFVSKHGAAKLPKDFMVQKEVAFCQFAGKDLQRWKVAEAQDLLRYQQEMLHYRPSEGYDANGNLIIATENENESKRRRKTLEEEGESQEREEESDDDEDDDEEEDSDDEQDEENGQSMSTTLTEYDQEALARLEREAKAKAKAKAKEEKAKAKENKARHKAAKNALNEEIADGPQYIPTPSLSLASASFNDMVYELLKYKTAKGNCRVPAKKGGVLGKWVDKLRKEYKKRKNGNNKTAASQANTAKDPTTKSSLAVQDNMRLDDERVDVLTELGMVWEFPNDDYEHIWQTRFKELVDFKEQHGHVNVPQKGHGSLSWWVKIQRELYVNTTSDHSKLPPRSRPRQTMPTHRIKQLESIGFEWRVRPNVVKWDQRYQELLEYKRVYGDCNVPQNYPPNRILGKWVMKQRGFYYDKVRGRKSPLTDEKQDKLEAIGFAWVAPHVCKTKVKLHLREHIMAEQASMVRVAQEETIPTESNQVDQGHGLQSQQQQMLEPESVPNPTLPPQHNQQLEQQPQPQQAPLQQQQQQFTHQPQPQQLPQQQLLPFANQAQMVQNPSHLHDLGEQLIHSLVATQTLTTGAPGVPHAPFVPQPSHLYAQGIPGLNLHHTADPLQQQQHQQQEHQYPQGQAPGQGQDMTQHYLQHAFQPLQQYGMQGHIVAPNYQFAVPDQQQQMQHPPLQEQQHDQTHHHIHQQEHQQQQLQTQSTSQQDQSQSAQQQSSQQQPDGDTTQPSHYYHQI